MKVLETINAPGKGSGTGDDRFGYDEASGRAWVLDGATDVGGIRMFEAEESDAAWIAQAYSDALTEPVANDESVETYFSRVFDTVAHKARNDARFDLDSVPRECRPIAAGVWCRFSPAARRLELASLGDCIAIVQAGDGAVEVFGNVEAPKDEAEEARRLLDLDPDERLEVLRGWRRDHNTSAKARSFGIYPSAVHRLNRSSLQVPEAGHVLLMSDGFYRLVTPYEAYTDDDLMAAARDNGLAALLNDLRDREQSSGDDRQMGRIKTSDDACAVLVRID